MGYGTASLKFDSFRAHQKISTNLVDRNEIACRRMALTPQLTPTVVRSLAKGACVPRRLEGKAACRQEEQRRPAEPWREARTIPHRIPRRVSFSNGSRRDRHGPQVHGRIGDRRDQSATFPVRRVQSRLLRELHVNFILATRIRLGRASTDKRLGV